MAYKNRPPHAFTQHPEHPMRFYARISEDGAGFTAACDSVEMSAWAATRGNAINDLLVALREAFGHVEAMAPPPDAKLPSIELVVLE